MLHQQNIIYFLVTAFIMTFYGWIVCPYIEKVSFLPLFISFILSLILSYGLLFKPLQSCLSENSSSKMVKRFLILQFSIYILAGVTITIFNFLYYQYPLGSGLKVIFGFSAFGFFFSIDQLLYLERSQFLKKQRQNNLAEIENLFPVSSKFRWLIFSILSYIFIFSSMAVFKDFDYLLKNNMDVNPTTLWAVGLDVLFIFLGTFALTWRVISSFSKNINMLFKRQILVLDQINLGNFNKLVPVSTQDEFGLIALHTNQMTKGLQEKEKVKSILGKTVGSEVARRLIDQNSNKLLQGENLNLAILFCDIRNFTNFSEKQSSEQVVKFLNHYFTAMNQAVNEHQGLIDKFIGDAILVVFGLPETSKTKKENEETACKQSFAAAEKMLIYLEEFNREQNLDFKIGIGIHFGEVTAGVLGTETRFEYTIIGDNVNLASRIESLTKALDYPIVISDKVYQQLDTQQQQNLTPLGEHSVKGKSNSVMLYGSGK